MKKSYKIICAVLAASSLVSCYADLSTEATFEIPEIYVTSPEYPDEIINIAYGQTLDISVVVTQEGRTEEDFSYFWEVDLSASRISSGRLELGETPAISYQVGSYPSDSPYILSCLVTDLTTGYGIYKYWRMYVVSSLGEGLLVAHTRDGGQSSELDLLACAPVTYGYTGDTPTYTRNIYALSNDGETIEGTVNSMTARVCCDGALFNESTIVLGTDNHIFTIDPVTYSVLKTDGSLFNMGGEETFSTSYLFNYAAYFSGAIINNTLYGIVCNSDNAYNKLSYNVTPSDVFYRENTCSTKLDQAVLSTFNGNTGYFYYMYGWQSLSGTFGSVECTPSFTLAGSTSIACGGIDTDTHAYIIRDTSENYHLCKFYGEGMGFAYTDYDFYPTEIENMVDYAFCDNSSLFYYATESSIYSVIIGGESLTESKLTWEPDSPNEKITHIYQYTQGWYGTHQYGLTSYEFVLSTNRLQIIIVTYNEATGEGKIYLRPFNVSTGRFTYSDNGTYDGFGEITAVCSTLR